MLAAGLIGHRALWRPLSGGRVAQVWRVRGGGADLVVKRSPRGRETPFFPVSATAEARAMAELSPLGLAPPPLAAFEAEGAAWLVYPFQPGRPARRATPDLMRHLRRLHLLPRPPVPRPLPAAPLGPEAVARLDAAGLGADALARIATARRALDAPAPAVALHGDPVPANVVVRPGGDMLLIDWQCAGRGDAVRDLAVALSPAMQHLYGAGPLDRQAREAALAAYGCRAAVARYEQAAPALGAAIALHCLDRAAAGGAAWRAAAALQLAQLAAIGA